MVKKYKVKKKKVQKLKPKKRVKSKKLKNLRGGSALTNYWKKQAIDMFLL